VDAEMYQAKWELVHTSLDLNSIVCLFKQAEILENLWTGVSAKTHSDACTNRAQLFTLTHIFRQAGRLGAWVHSMRWTPPTILCEAL
jgi:hypothetical protein